MVYLILAFSVGLLLIVIDHRKSIRTCISLFRGGKGGSELIDTNNKNPPKTISTILLAFAISLIPVFISFYSSYLLSLNRTRDENNAKGTSVLQVSDCRIQEFQGMLLAYDNPLFPQGRNLYYTPSDSEVVSHYIHKRYEWPPYFIFDHLPPEDGLTYFDSMTYNILFALEDNERSAMTVIKNSELSFKYRRKTMDALVKMDVFRKAMLELTLLKRTHQISDYQFESNRDYIGDSTDNLLNSLSER